LAHPLLIVDALIGLGLLVVIAVAARRPPATTSTGRRLIGCGLIAGPLPLAVALHLFVPLPTGLNQAAFIAGVIAFAVGAILVLGEDEREERSDPDAELEPEQPPWWPDFERGFRAYARSRSRPRIPH
jgi:hypothetical protein